MRIIYWDLENEESAGIHELEVNKLNNFEGANIPHIQVLKSAAGYYIGALCRADWSQEEFWEPDFRDSDCYWSKRIEAETALRTHKYPVKF